eukprot:gb/GFBE01005191.1/.p1 GENE.gb/GFBE01005191.1/~~gb/GFBE01005191.1/.p1  ORF type:complete len:112 (+),score=26.00 gb/GFBE01005191.1/:1-336(+)
MQQPMQQPMMYSLQMAPLPANGAVAWASLPSSESPPLPQLPQMASGRLSPVPQWPTGDGSNGVGHPEDPHPAVALARHAASLERQQPEDVEAQRKYINSLLLSAAPDAYTD